MTSQNQASQGFSLLELLVAMMIITIIATLGFKQFRKSSTNARYVKAQDELKTVAEGLDQYYLKHARYPDFSSYGAMVDNNSPLVKESLIKVGMSANDPFGQPYEGKSTRGNYELKCEGAPDYPEDFGPFTWTPGQGQTLLSNGTPSSGEAGAPKSGTAPAGGGK